MSFRIRCTALGMLLAATGCADSTGTVPDQLTKASASHERRDLGAKVIEGEGSPNAIVGRYIVGLADPTKLTEFVAAYRSSGAVSAHYELPNAKLVVVQTSAENAKAMLSDTRVQYIEQDGWLTPTSHQDTSRSTFINPIQHWWLDRVDTRTLTFDNEYKWSVVGAGTHIWIVDNGVDAYHPELHGRVNLAQGHTYQGQNPFESCATGPHGTDMALRAAGFNQGELGPVPWTLG
jgi:lipocalin